LVCHRSVWSS